MQKQKYFLRYVLIIQKLKFSKAATFEELKDYLELQSELADFDLNISKRTFERDKNEIHSLFNILIEYDFSRKVYYIKEEEQQEINNRMLESFNMFNSLNMSDNLAPHIIFEKRRPQGTEHFYGLLHAIKNRFNIKFTYTKFWDDDCSDRIVEPYALKEARYRWYLLAKDAKDNLVKTFGLDRISELEITKKHFQFPKDFNPGKNFEHSFGILTNAELEPKEVILSFDPFQGKYVKSFPLHESQQITIDNKKEIRFKLKIHITKDFIMELLSYGDAVKIIAPKSLKNQVCKVLENALELNK